MTPTSLAKRKEKKRNQGENSRNAYKKTLCIPFFDTLLACC